LAWGDTRAGGAAGGAGMAPTWLVMGKKPDPDEDKVRNTPRTLLQKNPTTLCDTSCIFLEMIRGGQARPGEAGRRGRAGAAVRGGCGDAPGPASAFTGGWLVVRGVFRAGREADGGRLVGDGGSRV